MTTPTSARETVVKPVPKVSKAIPQGIADALTAYIEQGVRPGMCVTYILENRLVDAFVNADQDTVKAMKDIAHFIYHYAPAKCWGSHEAVEEWIKAGGWYGIYAPKAAEEQHGTP